jgi:hypothetical protein
VDAAAGGDENEGELSAWLGHLLVTDVTLTITLSDIEAHAIATVVASLGPEHSHTSTNIGSTVGRPARFTAHKSRPNMVDLVSEAAERVYEALADAGQVTPVMTCRQSTGRSP